jgi:hypothetical protein
LRTSQWENTELSALEVTQASVLSDDDEPEVEDPVEVAMRDTLESIKEARKVLQSMREQPPADKKDARHQSMHELRNPSGLEECEPHSSSALHSRMKDAVEHTSNEPLVEHSPKTFISEQEEDPTQNPRDERDSRTMEAALCLTLCVAWTLCHIFRPPGMNEEVDM